MQKQDLGNPKCILSEDKVFQYRQSEIAEVEKLPRHTGKREHIAFLRGEHLTHRERILAECSRCSGGFVDGFHDCLNPLCCLYGIYPFPEESQFEGAQKSSDDETHAGGTS
jgi:hypothetical protein